MNGGISKYYAVRDGRETGIYRSWDECRVRTDGYSRASYWIFDHEGDAIRFMTEYAPRHPETRAQVYTDGCCFYNGQLGARGGYGVFWGYTDPRNVSEPVRGRQTNNSAEIQAVTRAIEDAKRYGYRSIDVYTDSTFVIHAVYLWMPRWKQNGWTCAYGYEVKNREDFEALDRALIHIDVNIQYVPGHSGIPGNEAAHNLARRGCNR